MRPLAIQIMRSEHRSIEAIIQGFQLLTQSLKSDEPAPDYKVLRAMLYYLDAFPERLHHPKEDRYLFARIRQRTNESEDIISRLENDHLRGEDKIRRLMQSVIRLECGGPSYLSELAEQIEDYAAFHRRHMELEETVVWPLAQRVLTDDDWQAIDVAFAENVDPLSGVDTKNDFDKLFVSIVNLVRSPACVL